MESRFGDAGRPGSAFVVDRRKVGLSSDADLQNGITLAGRVGGL